MRAIVLALALLAAAAPAQDLTRAEVAKLSPHDLAVRVLGDLAKDGTAKELKYYVSPVAPTPPWLEQVEVDFPVRWLDSPQLCEANRVVVDFAPHDPDARSHMFDGKYDPPVFVTDVANYFRFAPSTTRDCKAISDSAYFSATDTGQAEQALDAFKLFRKDTAHATCVDLTGDWTCPKDLSGITAFSGVISVQDERKKDASITRTVVLAIPVEDSRDARELWLTVEFGKDVRLARAELRNIWGPPIP